MEVEAYLQPLNCTRIGSKSLNEFTTQNLMEMCFLKRLLNFTGNPTKTDKLQLVKLENIAKHLVKFCVKLWFL